MAGAVRRRGDTGALATTRVGRRRRAGRGGRGRGRTAPRDAVRRRPMWRRCHPAADQGVVGDRCVRSPTSARRCSTRWGSRRSWCSRRSPRRSSPASVTSTCCTAAPTRLNRAMAAFCSDDRRLLAVGSVPWAEPARTIEAATRALDEGCAAIQVPTDLPRGVVAPSHPDHDGLWALLEEANVARRQPHRRRRPSGPARLPRQRSSGERLPRRWRERPLEGLPRHPPAARGVLGRARPRRRLRPLPRPAWRVGRGGRDVGRRVDPPARPGHAVRPHRGAAPRPRATTRARTSTATSASRRSPASRSGG